MKNNFIEITDNVSDTYYVNIDSVAYLKEGVGTASSRPIYKIVLTNDKQILITSKVDFARIRDESYGDNNI
jgi:hypothetical protein